MDFFKGGNLNLSIHLTRAAGMQIFDKIVHCVTAAAHFCYKKYDLKLCLFTSEIKEYFENSFDLYETLFKALKGECFNNDRLRLLYHRQYSFL